MEPINQNYLAACRNVERMAAVRRRRVQTLVGAAAFAIFAGVFIWVNHAYLQEQWRWISTIYPYMRSQVWPHVLTAEKERALKPRSEEHTSELQPHSDLVC